MDKKQTLLSDYFSLPNKEMKMNVPIHRMLLASQDDFEDFLTPQDQPVLHLSNPNSPSPLKKRYRLNVNGMDNRNQEEDIHHLTQDMVVLDVNAKMDSNRERHYALGMPNSAKKVKSMDLPEIQVNPFLDHEERPTEKRKRNNTRRLSLPNPGVSVGLVPSRFLYEYVELELIGKGSFSQVYKCVKRIDGFQYAIKKHKRHLRGKADKQNALREVYALASLPDCNYVIRYYDAWVEDDLLYVQLEYCPGGSLADKQNSSLQQGCAIPEEELRLVMFHVGVALREIHKRDMAHLDIKPANILLARNSIYKLADFGNATSINVETSSVPEGDNRYLSRELLQGNSVDLRTGDIFAFGATMYEIALGCPNGLPGQGQEWQNLRDGNLVTLPYYSRMFQHLISAMMHPDPLQRPTAVEILQHESLRYLHNP